MSRHGDGAAASAVAVGRARWIALVAAKTGEGRAVTHTRTHTTCTWARDGGVGAGSGGR